VNDVNEIVTPKPSKRKESLDKGTIYAYFRSK